MTKKSLVLIHNIFKNGLRIKDQEVHKQVRDQRNGVQTILEMKIYAKASAIPILTILAF